MTTVYLLSPDNTTWQLPAVVIPRGIPSLSDGRDTGHHNKEGSSEKNQRHLNRDKPKIQPSERKEHLKKKKVTDPNKTEPTTQTTTTTK